MSSCHVVMIMMTMVMAIVMTVMLMLIPVSVGAVWFESSPDVSEHSVVLCCEYIIQNMHTYVQTHRHSDPCYTHSDAQTGTMGNCRPKINFILAHHHQQQQSRPTDASMAGTTEIGAFVASWS
jgi:hypothetical protein